jgi:hypothetical protein
VYDAAAETAGTPWVDTVRYDHVWRLPPLFTGAVQDGSCDGELPAVIPVCSCREVMGLTARAAARRMIRVHNRRARADLCRGRFILEGAF